jgi:hypothetical protein
LVIEGRQAARDGHVATALARFREASQDDATFATLDPDSLATRIAVDATIEQGLSHLHGRHLPEAMSRFRSVRALAPGSEQAIVPDITNAIAELLGNGDTSIVAPALEAYQEAAAWDSAFTPGAATLNSICWWGTLARRAREVADVCERAVRVGGDNGDIRDSRGVNRALRGDLKGAMEDFRAFVEWTSVPEEKARRQQWLRELAQGRNPFTDRMLEILRHE